MPVGRFTFCTEGRNPEKGVQTSTRSVRLTEVAKRPE